MDISNEGKFHCAKTLVHASDVLRECCVSAMLCTPSFFIVHGSHCQRTIRFRDIARLGK